MILEDTNTPRWDVARGMCKRYGYDPQEIAERLERFRAIRDEFAAAEQRKREANKLQEAA